MFKPAAFLALLVLAGAGCRHLGAELERGPLPPGAPGAEEILSDLAANDAALENFRGPCSVTLESPKLAATQVLQQSSVYYRRPSDLHVVGRKYGSTVMRLTCAGKEFLIEFPTEDEYYYRLEGEFVGAVDFSVSPADIAREMFFPEPWATMPPGRLIVTGFDDAAQTAAVELLDAERNFVYRRLQLQGRPWVVVQDERFDLEGRVVAVTRLRDYRVIDGIHLPAWVEAVFPLEETSMKLEFRQLKPNTTIEDKYFDIDARASELQIVLDKSTAAPQQGKY